jgi:hypothetical protein
VAVGGDLDGLDDGADQPLAVGSGGGRRGPQRRDVAGQGADRPQGRSLLAALPGPGRPAGAVVVADPWRLLPRRPAPGGTSILTQLAFRRVQLVLADSGMVISSAREYALLGRLLPGPGGGQKVRGSQPAQPAAGLSRRPGEVR